MIGSLFAGHTESPGELVEEDGQQFKEYFGSASEFQKGTHQNVEGKRILVPYKGSISDTLTEMRQDLQSSISYAGGKRLSDYEKWITFLSVILFLMAICCRPIIKIMNHPFWGDSFLVRYLKTFPLSIESAPKQMYNDLCRFHSVDIEQKRV